MNRNHLLDLLRAVLTIFVLFYHLGICEAGFLAVCGFFVISGYLLASSLNRDDFSLKDYYLKRLKTIYLPLVIVTLTTVLVFRYVVNIPWVSIKQETYSVLLGYNNYFQISANNNYFIRSDASPFTHMWYISILIQVEFILPLIVCGLKSLRIKINKYFLFILTFLSTICFVVVYYTLGMSCSYYDTVSRLFSFLMGCSVYHINHTSSNKTPLVIILIMIIAICLVGELSQNYYVLLMILISVLCGLFIIFTRNIDSKKYSLIDGVCKISYYVYLTQYPIIYIVDTVFDYNKQEKIIIECLLIICLSIVYVYGLSNRKEKFRKFVLIIVVVATLIGAYGFVTCPDYYKQMEDLKQQLEINQDILAKKQEEYLENIKQQQNLVLENVGQINEALDNLDDTVKNTQVLLIGDSIMLGGSFNLDEYFNNYYCDAKGSRNGFLAYETLSELLNMGIVGDYIVIHLGTNSGLELEEVEEINSLLDGQKIIWLSVTNGWRTSMNPMLEEYCNTHENNYLADWYNFSLGHSEYFVSDGLHLSDNGRRIYDQFIFDNLKDIIKQDLLTRKQEMIDAYNDANNNTVSFYGNDLLINIYGDLDKNYLYYIDSEGSFDSLYAKLNDNKEQLNISKTVFILLDSSMIITDEQLESIYELLSDNNVYVFAYNKNTYDLNVLLDSSCYMEDGVHLNKKGNKIVVEKINSLLNNTVF